MVFRKFRAQSAPDVLDEKSVSNVNRKHSLGHYSSASGTFDAVSPVSTAEKFPDENAYPTDIWNPGDIRNAPWAGLLALFGVIICTAGCFAILFSSRDEVVDGWAVLRLSPSVWLAIISTSSSVMLQFALTCGVAITWWHRALKGATVNDLGRTWSFGYSLWSAMTAGRYIDILAVSSIVTSLSVISTPLFQRASSVNTLTRSVTYMASPRIVPRIPYGYTGISTSRDGRYLIMTPAMTAIIQQFSPFSGIRASFLCEGPCNTTIKAPGLDTQCNSRRIPVDYRAIIKAGNVTDPQVAFSTNFTQLYNESSGIEMVVAYTDSINDMCQGTMTVNTCILRPATLHYSAIVNSRQMLNLWQENSTKPRLIDRQNSSYYNTLGGDTGCISTGVTLGGITLAARHLFQSSAKYEYVDPEHMQSIYTGSLANGFLSVSPTNLGSSFSNCNMTWKDPTQTILKSLTELMFLTGVYAGNFDSNKNPLLGDIPLYPAELRRFDNTTMAAWQILNITGAYKATVYHSEYPYLAGAIALLLLSVALVLPTFYGFWDLGRPISLNPIETGKAFNAPLLAGPGSNASLEALAKRVGSIEVRYGEEIDGTHIVLEADADGKVEKRCLRTLRLAGPKTVMVPERGVFYY